LQGREDLAHRQVVHSGAQTAQHLAAKTRHAKLEAFVVVERVDFPLEPAAHLDTGAGAQERFDVEGCRDASHNSWPPP
jgi:hypothetical protein